MNWYIELVTAHPILTAILQFAVLGTLGDAVSHWIVKRRISFLSIPLEIRQKKPQKRG